MRQIQGVRVAGGEQAPFAAEVLRDAFGDGDVPVRLAADPALGEHADGAFSVDVPAEGEIVIAGDPFAGLLHGARELAGRAGGGAVPVGAFAASPGLSHRVLWTWDHSTNWDDRVLGQQEIGALNAYQKPAGAFLDDYRRLVDFASLNRIGAIVVYGLLRDSHGGVESARQLCEYANARGVRILAGVGINAYGGIYFDGTHDHNLATWLRRRPDLRATMPPHPGFDIADFGDLYFPASEYMMAACPSQPDNLAWHRDAIEWLLETVPVGGINFETGDYGSCACDACRANTGAERTSWSYGAMRSVYPNLLDIARRPGPAGTPLRHLVEVYWDNIFDIEAQQPIADLPDDVAYQYCVNWSFWQRERDRLTAGHVRRLPHSVNVLRTHAGSQWNRQRHTWMPEAFADMATRSAAAGMRGFTVFGEASAYHPPNEVNYLAFACFSWDPRMSWDSFWRDDVVPRFGGTAEAELFQTRVRELGGPEPGLPALSRTRGEALEVAAASNGDVQRRWLWLAERAARSGHAMAAGRG